MEHRGSIGTSAGFVIGASLVKPSPENAPLGANIAQGVDILWD